MPSRWPYSTTNQSFFLKNTTSRGGAKGGGRPGEKGAGSGRKRGKLHNAVQYFEIEKIQRGGSQQYRAGLKGTGRGRFKPPVPPPPPTSLQQTKVKKKLKNNVNLKKSQSAQS